MTIEDFICPECGNDSFEKDYESDLSVEFYCNKCGLLLGKNDYSMNNWSRRGYRPNSWDICYSNYVIEYFKELPSESDNSHLGSHVKYEGNLSVDEIPYDGRIRYDKYLKVNLFQDNIESKLKYLRRYNSCEFNKCLETIRSRVC